MLEDHDVLAELPAILSVPEIDAFVIGVGDLSVSMGFPGETSRSEVQAVVDHIASEIIGAGGVLAQEANDPNAARLLMQRGYRMIDCAFITVASAALRQFVTSAKNKALIG
jgi:2-keto-3-deoxy-L-rhamnonate aldolase RhmA